MTTCPFNFEQVRHAVLITNGITCIGNFMAPSNPIPLPDDAEGRRIMENKGYPKLFIYFTEQTRHLTVCTCYAAQLFLTLQYYEFDAEIVSLILDIVTPISLFVFFAYFGIYSVDPFFLFPRCFIPSDDELIVIRSLNRLTLTPWWIPFQYQIPGWAFFLYINEQHVLVPIWMLMESLRATPATQNSLSYLIISVACYLCWNISVWTMRDQAPYPIQQWCYDQDWSIYPYVGASIGMLMLHFLVLPLRSMEYDCYQCMLTLTGLLLFGYGVAIYKCYQFEKVVKQHKTTLQKQAQ